jgi:hypothetical protein
LLNTAAAEAGAVAVLNWSGGNRNDTVDEGCQSRGMLLRDGRNFGILERHAFLHSGK